MVWVEVRDNEAGQPASRQRPRYECFPDCPRGIVADAGIEYRPTITIVDEIDIDVIELKGEGNAHPQEAWGNLLHLAGLGRTGKGKPQAALGVFFHPSPWSVVECVSLLLLRR